MSHRCPAGHESTASDYCDVCGSPLEPSPSARPDRGDTTARTFPERCPRCGSGRVGRERFCEQCGHDHSVSVDAMTSLDPGPEVVTWSVTVEVDRDWWCRLDLDGLPFPEGVPARSILLDADEVVIGRRADADGAEPAIDLGVSPEDVAVSRRHARLVRLDEAWSVADLGSANGTWLNDAPGPLAPGETTPLTAGDQIHLGAWTTITLVRRAP